MVSRELAAQLLAATLGRALLFAALTACWFAAGCGDFIVEKRVRAELATEAQAALSEPIKMWRITCWSGGVQVLELDTEREPLVAPSGLVRYGMEGERDMISLACHIRRIQ